MNISSVNIFNQKLNINYEQKQVLLPKSSTNTSQNTAVSFGNYHPYTPIHTYFDAHKFLDSIKYENAEKKYITFSESKTGEPLKFESEEIAPNKGALKRLKELDGLTLEQKRSFISEYCKMTGFPNLSEVSDRIDNEILNGIYTLANERNFDVKFIGYDCNSSVGRRVALPGSDCDGLFIIIDSKDNKQDYFAGCVRWDLKDVINQRILQTHALGLPEVLTVDYIKKGLKIARDAFDSASFSAEELSRFEENLYDNTSDFVKSADFNIQLAKYIPQDTEVRDMYYKTAMFVELLRDGRILENGLDKDFIDEIKNNPLYKYSNIMKQRGLKNKLKHKHIQRCNYIADFNKQSIDKQFDILKDILYNSFRLPGQNPENSQFFENLETSDNDEMGNILEMYDLLIHSPYEE